MRDMDPHIRLAPADEEGVWRDIDGNGWRAFLTHHLLDCAVCGRAVFKGFVPCGFGEKRAVCERHFDLRRADGSRL
jgi:hypothetical protein